VAAGTCIIDLTSSAPGYTTASVTYTIIVTPLTTVISVGGVSDPGNLGATAAYGAVYQVPAFTTSDPTATLTESFGAGSTVCSGTVGSTIDFSAAGTCVIDLTSTAKTPSGYTTASATFTIIVGPQTSTINVGGVTDSGNLDARRRTGPCT